MNEVTKKKERKIENPTIEGSLGSCCDYRLSSFRYWWSF